MLFDKFREKPEDVQPEDIKSLGRRYKNTMSASDFLDRANSLKTAQLKARGIEETVNEALAKFRKTGK
jgi:hypothetical protein